MEFNLTQIGLTKSPVYKTRLQKLQILLNTFLVDGVKTSISDLLSNGSNTAQKCLFYETSGVRTSGIRTKNVSYIGYFV